MKMIPLEIEEMFRTGAVSEEFFDTRNFQVYRDMNGVKYTLNSTVDHLTRSKVMYHPKVLQDKRTAISLAHTAKLWNISLLVPFHSSPHSTTSEHMTI